MISKDLKKLNRRELVDIIYQLKKNDQQKQEEIAALEAALQEKRIKIASAGSVADAAAEVTQLLTAAQNTANLYLEEIASMKEDTEKECNQKIEEARKTVDEILANGEKQFAELNAQYQAAYQKWEQLQQEIRQLEDMKMKG